MRGAGLAKYPADRQRRLRPPFSYSGLCAANPALSPPACRLLQRLQVRTDPGEDFPGEFFARYFFPGYAGHQFKPFLDMFHVRGSLFGATMCYCNDFSTTNKDYPITV